MAGVTLLVRSAARQWATLFTALALTLFIFNVQDWRAVFGAVAGILAIVLSGFMLQAPLGSRTEPPVAA